ncbi:hypothetical protein NOCARDAX2BIS_110011 [Nocardioides sp. AX2bis]|nr:hypothetical protein NOCARDAX2BIS_110011 [Nocardioides sp. AX2bis]
MRARGGAGGIGWDRPRPAPVSGTWAARFVALGGICQDSSVATAGFAAAPHILTPESRLPTSSPLRAGVTWSVSGSCWRRRGTRPGRHEPRRPPQADDPGPRSCLLEE